MTRSLLAAPIVLLALACGGKTEAAARPAASRPSATAPSAAQLAKGKEIFAARCSFCHGETGDGDTPISAGYPGANLADGKWVHGGTPDEIALTIANGVPDTPMQGFREMMMPADIDAVTAYIRSLTPVK